MADQELEQEVPSYLDMSDEDMMKVDPAALGQPAQEAVVDTDPDPEGTSPVEAAVVGEGSGADGDGVDDKADDQAEVVEPADKVEPLDKTPDSGVTDAVPTNVDVKPAEKELPAGEVAPELDYKAEYERLLAPFKANGRDIKVTGVEDAISLMQMGANYNKKMAGLKPNLKMLKLLENNGLLSEEKLSYLIDLSKKDPAAINKLVKESGIDPLDLSANDKEDYKPKNYSVDDLEMELDTVLDELQESPTYNRTLDLVSNKWDAKSKQIIANSPQVLRIINDHMQSGIYDAIQNEIESERVFGRLNGLSDIDAYRQVGDAIQARGGFDHLGQKGHQPAPTPRVAAPKPSGVDEDKLKDKRRAASSSKPVIPAVAKEFNPLSLSDEDFAKHSKPI